jgi:hypothetical protein
MKIVLKAINNYKNCSIFLEAKFNFQKIIIFQKKKAPLKQIFNAFIFCCSSEEQTKNSKMRLRREKKTKHLLDDFKKNAL